MTCQGNTTIQLFEKDEINIALKKKKNSFIIAYKIQKCSDIGQFSSRHVAETR